MLLLMPVAYVLNWNRVCRELAHKRWGKVAQGDSSNDYNNDE